MWCIFRKKEMLLKTLLTLVFIHIGLVIYAQGIDNANNPPKRIFSYVSQIPQSSVDIKEYLKENLVYPLDARRNNIEGKVIVKFIVDENGKVTNVTIAKSVYPSIDSEAIRVISNMPNWIPGHNDGKPIKVNYTLPIDFKLLDSKK